MSLVDREVDPRHELAAVTKAIQNDGDNAVLFNNVSGTNFPVVSNLYGSHKRICEIIGAAEDGFCKRWKEISQSPVKHEIYENIEMPGDIVSGKLSDLPLITYHEKDAGPYLNAASTAKEAARQFVRENGNRLAGFLKCTNLHKVHGVPPEKSTTHFMRYVYRAAAEKLYADGFFSDALTKSGLLALFYEKNIDFYA